jgi:hypothetical protein
MTQTEKLLAFAAGGGALGALIVGGPIGIVGGALVGGVAKLAFGGSKRKAGGSVGDDGSGVLSGGGVATIEEARFAKSQLKQQIFSRPDVPWWLVGVGIGGSPGSYCVVVSVSDTPPEMRSWVPKQVQGVPVVADASGAQTLEMSTGL